MFVSRGHKVMDSKHLDRGWIEVLDEKDPLTEDGCK